MGKDEQQLLKKYEKYLNRQIEKGKIREASADKDILFINLYLEELLPRMKTTIDQTGKTEVAVFLQKYIPRKIRNYDRKLRRKAIGSIRRFYKFLLGMNIIDKYQLAEATNVIRKLSQP